MAIKFKFLKDLKADKPCVIAGFPGIGYVAKIALDYLAEKLRADVYAEVYSHAFPPFIIVRENGVIEPLKVDLLYSSLDGKDFLLITGNAQPATPEGQHELIDALISEISGRYRVTRVFAMAAYVVENRVGEPNIYGAATDSATMDLLKTHGVKPMTEGSISGANGIILSYAKAIGVPAACLLSETPAYTYYGQFADAKAAEALLKVITSILGVSIDMTDIEEKARGSEEILRRLSRLAEERFIKEVPQKTFTGDLTYIG
ncbi:MAG: PAC2 family protein [Nitrososphaerota archaeon]|nr:PAC2 family protein [Candidatus Bathyarchaeota archaeon]MDW8049303.1 PAC2 family protein [Nitrososphaerota archaeon]